MQKAFLSDANCRLYFYPLQIFFLRIGCFENAGRMISFCPSAIFQMRTAEFNFACCKLFSRTPDTFKLHHPEASN